MKDSEPFRRSAKDRLCQAPPRPALQGLENFSYPPLRCGSRAGSLLTEVMTMAHATQFWQQRTNVWRRATSPARGASPSVTARYRRLARECLEIAHTFIQQELPRSAISQGLP